MTLNERLRALESLARALWRDALNFPWRNTAITLRERFREDRLGITASSLTFTTTISLVPLFTVALAIFSAFPMFERLQLTLQRWLVQSLVPPDIAKQVFSYLNQFASKAGQMGWAGALVLLITALALILTIDRKLNDIWRVRQPRSLTQRVLVYWAVLTLGPLLLAGSLTVTTFAV
ncbi:MAG: YihY family inner membrane protein, partial [Hydrogenophaga sp.]|nr:YihY family inner membrane protein [Hydrogenophaga sp.]